MQTTVSARRRGLLRRRIKKAEPFDPAFALLSLNMDLLFQSLHFYLNEIDINDI
jgi:hypothetical protein